MFRIGQRVVYVGNNPLFHNKVYTVIAIRKACCVDALMYDVGMNPVPGYNPGSQCPVCWKTFSEIWKYEKTLRPLDEDYAEGVLSEIKKSTLDETLELLEQIKTKETI